MGILTSIFSLLVRDEIVNNTGNLLFSILVQPLCHAVIVHPAMLVAKGSIWGWTKKAIKKPVFVHMKGMLWPNEIIILCVVLLQLFCSKNKMVCCALCRRGSNKKILNLKTQSYMACQARFSFITTKHVWMSRDWICKRELNKMLREWRIWPSLIVSDNPISQNPVARKRKFSANWKIPTWYTHCFPIRDFTAVAVEFSGL